MIHSDPRPAAFSAIESGCVSLDGLWLQYMARGGNADVLELDAYIHDVPLLHGLEVEILSTTLKEILPAAPASGGSTLRRTMKRASIAPPGPASKQLHSVMKHWPLSALAGPHRDLVRLKRVPGGILLRNCPIGLGPTAGLLWKSLQSRGLP